MQEKQIIAMFYKLVIRIGKKNMPLLLLMAIAFNGFQCKDYSNKLLGPSIILTVDKPPDTWYQLKDFLKENNVKLTFYIESYQNLSDSTKRIMKEMEADGHEMAHHTTTHPHSDEYLEKYGKIILDEKGNELARTAKRVNVISKIFQILK